MYFVRKTIRAADVKKGDQLVLVTQQLVEVDRVASGKESTLIGFSHPSPSTVEYNNWFSVTVFRTVDMKLLPATDTPAPGYARTDWVHRYTDVVDITKRAEMIYDEIHKGDS